MLISLLRAVTAFAIACFASAASAQTCYYSTPTCTGGGFFTSSWTGSAIGAAYGGTGVANNVANTITFSGNYGLGLTLSGATALTLPTSGTVFATGSLGAFADGTVSAPGITFSADLSSGLYRIGTDDIALATNGTKALEINSSQAVSIPAGLTVTTSFTATGLVTLTDIATQNANTFVANSTGSSASPTAITGATAEGLLQFTGVGSGATQYTLDGREKQVVYYKDYNPTMDCTTDDSVALQAAINALPHGGLLYMPDQQFCSAIASTVTNQKGVLIAGSRRGQQHGYSTDPDWGTCRLKWTGASSGTMLDMSATSGATSQRTSGGGIIGCSLDGNSALGGTGLNMKSVFNATIDVFIKDWATYGVYVGVVATLGTGESRDSQHNFITINGAEMGGTSDGQVLVLDGDTTANSAYNKIDMRNIYYSNSVPFECKNCDNNNISARSVYLVNSGTAATALQCDASSNSNETCRANLFEYISVGGTKSIWFQGTEIATYGSSENTIDFYDYANIGFAPTFGTGVIVSWRDNQYLNQTIAGNLTIGSGSAIGAAWNTSFSSSASCAVGSPTTITPTIRYEQIGKTILLNAQIALTAINSCTTSVIFTVPGTSNASISTAFSAVNVSTLALEFARLPPGSNQITVLTPAGTFPGVNGDTLLISGAYETQ